MQIMIKETGEIKTLKLLEHGSSENLARIFAKQRAGVKRDKPNRNKGVKEYTMTHAEWMEWEDIMRVAQKNLTMRHEFEYIHNEDIHDLIEGDIEDAWLHHLKPRHDKLFALKNAVNAEYQIWKRLASGVVTVKLPIDPSEDNNVSQTLSFTHYRHTKTEAGEQWDMQIDCGFTMNMPFQPESFDFKAGIQLQYNRNAETGDIIEAFCEEEWLFPFSMSNKQEEVVLTALRTAADNNIDEQ